MSTIEKIATALAELLNSAEAPYALGEGVSATWSPRPQFDLDALGVLHVTIVPAGVELVRADRARWWWVWSLDVGIQQRLDAELALADETARLLELTEQIVGWISSQPLAACPDAKLVRIAIEPIYSAEHLARMGQFTSVIRTGYQT